MPTVQLRTSLAPMTASTRRSPNASSGRRRTLNAYIFRVAAFRRSAQSSRNVREDEFDGAAEAAREAKAKTLGTEDFGTEDA